MTDAYELGRRAALAKYAAFTHDDLVTMLGAVSPAAAGVGGAMTAPEGHEIGTGVRTGVGAGVGRVTGGSVGPLVATALAKILKKDPASFQNIGNALGQRIGGAVGANAGNSWSRRAINEAHTQSQPAYYGGQ